MRPSLVRTSIALLVLLPACGGGSDSPTDPGGDGPPTSGRTVKDSPSFASDIQEIFNRRGCAAAACHGVAEEAGLRLEPGSAYGELVGVQATSEDFLRVEPGDAENSYVVIKVEGRQSVGGRMPLGFTPLDDIDITNIRNWIDQGAGNN